MTRRHRSRSVVVVALALLVAALLGACGVRPDDGVRITEADDVPFGLLDTVPEASSPTTSAATPTDRFGAYFVRSGLLVAVPTEAAAPVGPQAALDVLLAGPRPDDLRRGLRTALAGDHLIRSSDVVGGVATVDLDDTFRALAPREQLLGLGQIVLTLTTLRGIGSVDIEVQGKAAEVRVGDGSLKPGPVTRDDYIELLATS